MNEQPTTTTKEDIPQLNENCACCLTVPISHLALETPVPMAGWQQLFDEMGIRVLVDPAGRKAISTLAVRMLLTARRREAELAAERAARQFEKLDARRPAMAGFPPVEGMTALESLTTSPGYQTVADEFPGRQRPDFLREELAAGQRADDEKKRLAVERKKQRLVDEMKERLR